MMTASVSTWKQNASPQAWVQGKIYYNVKGSNGVFEGYSADPDGSNASCLTCIPAFPSSTQHGIGDVTPDGKYALITVERSGHWPIADGDMAASPGEGAYNDLWLEATDKSHAWKLVDLLKTGSSALIWPRFDRTGTRVVWSEQNMFNIEWFGYWTLHVADLIWTNGIPSLTNIKTLVTKSFAEPYGFSPDGSKILFSSNIWNGGSLDQSNSQIVTMASTLAGNITRLSPKDTWCEGWWCPFTNYNEFAFYTPDGSKIIFSRIVGGHNGSLEYWTMNPDGSNPTQLTFFSAPPATATTIFTGLAFNPNNPNQFISAVETDYNGDYFAALVNTK